MKDSFASIRCPHCKGCGRLPLTGIYLDTLRGVRRKCAMKGGNVVANRDAAWFGCKATALNNRLVRLEELGFLRSEKYGRQRRFTLA
jgi:hypothetical protein